MTFGNKQYDVVLGTIYVPENRLNLQSRLIEIPVKIIKSPATAAIPIFYLAGGPGQTNLDFSPPRWLLKNYDMVFVGYRGVDGSVRLDTPEIGRAFSKKQDPLSFISLWHRGGNSVPNAAQLFDAFIAAKNGDDSGLAMLSSFFDLVMPSVFVWGDTLLKAVSADFDPKRDYLTEMDPPGSIMGSPSSKFVWGAAQLMETVVPTIPEEYRTVRESDVPTLMISGSVDFSDPAENATRLLAYLKNGRQVILSEFGHVSDLWNLQPEAIKHLMLAYYKDGTVDDSLFHYAPMNFTPRTSLQSMARRGM